MNVDILTIFPGMFEGPLTESIIKKAREKKLLQIRFFDIRSFAKDKHHSVDDRPFGGGPGMLMKPEPIYEAIGEAKKAARKDNKKAKPYVVFLSPQGSPLNTEIAQKLAGKKHLILLCGRYEGVDERVLDWVDEEISIGDYVLTGGELPAMVLIDAVARMIPGVVKEADSVKRDSFFEGLLDFPNYTRPPQFKGKKVPDVLLSGNHEKIEKWRKEQALKKTKQKRPDLLKRTGKIKQ